MVSNNFPAHPVKELIALAKSKPGEINYASAGNGTGQHLSMELFKLMAGVNLTHVPYRGAAPAYTDVISGKRRCSSTIWRVHWPNRGGTVRALVVTGMERSPPVPDVPTVAEAGVPGYQNYVRFGLWAPKKTPQPIVEKSYAEIRKALADPTVKERIAKDAGVPMDMPLADIEPFVKPEIANWVDAVKRAGISVQ